jgi:uncharacterized protein (TIGR02466 family)|tara:strand:+ start:196 stop:765 length:570 start_codon:yes stop_codon:yes gene_type:complete
MAKHIIFSDAISLNKFQDFELDNWIQTTLDQTKKKDEGVNFSNVGGYQTPSVVDKKITEILGKYIAEAMKDFTSTNFKYQLMYLWINENYKYSHNTLHFHGKSQFSGVYYYKVPKNSGDLVFQRNDATAFMCLEDFYKSIDSRTTYKVKPEPGLLAIFPGTYLHAVSQSMSDEPRVSIAFNFNILEPLK